MKKHYKTIELILFIIIILVFAFIIKLRINNIDVSEMRLLVMCWKEYLACVIILTLSYGGIKFIGIKK